MASICTGQFFGGPCALACTGGHTYVASVCTGEFLGGPRALACTGGHSCVASVCTLGGPRACACTGGQCCVASVCTGEYLGGPRACACSGGHRCAVVRAGRASYAFAGKEVPPGRYESAADCPTSDLDIRDCLNFYMSLYFVSVVLQ